MKLITFYKAILDLHVPIFSTNDIAAVLRISNKYSYKLLKQLSNEGLMIHLRRGVWGIKESVDLLEIPDYLTAPMPSYISLQSALYYHGIISQIPSVIYAVTIARTRRYHTTIGTYSMHHINPDLFFGFDFVGNRDIRMAQPEKALFDFFYFKSTKSKLFYSLPEIEIPSTFTWDKLEQYTKKIGNKSRQRMLLNSIHLLKSRSSHQHRQSKRNSNDH